MGFQPPGGAAPAPQQAAAPAAAPPPEAAVPAPAPAAGAVAGYPPPSAEQPYPPPPAGYPAAAPSAGAPGVPPPAVPYPGTDAAAPPPQTTTDPNTGKKVAAAVLLTRPRRMMRRCVWRGRRAGSCGAGLGGGCLLLPPRAAVAGLRQYTLLPRIAPVQRHDVLRRSRQAGAAALPVASARGPGRASWPNMHLDYRLYPTRSPPIS